MTSGLCPAAALAGRDLDLGTSSCFAGCGLMDSCATDEMTSAKVVLPLCKLQLSWAHGCTPLCPES